MPIPVTPDATVLELRNNIAAKIGASTDLNLAIVKSMEVVGKLIRVARDAPYLEITGPRGNTDTVFFSKLDAPPAGTPRITDMSNVIILKPLPAEPIMFDYGMIDFMNGIRQKLGIQDFDYARILQRMLEITDQVVDLMSGEPKLEIAGPFGHETISLDANYVWQTPVQHMGITAGLERKIDFLKGKWHEPFIKEVIQKAATLAVTFMQLAQLSNPLDWEVKAGLPGKSDNPSVILEGAQKREIFFLNNTSETAVVSINDGATASGKSPIIGVIGFDANEAGAFQYALQLVGGSSFTETLSRCVEISVKLFDIAGDMPGVLLKGTNRHYNLLPAQHDLNHVPMYDFVDYSDTYYAAAYPNAANEVALSGDRHAASDTGGAVPDDPTRKLPNTPPPSRTP